MSATYALPVLPLPPITRLRVPVTVLAAVALAAAAMLWGTSFVAAKVVLADLPPITVAVLRFAIAAAVLVPLACRDGCRPSLGIQPALLGLTGVTLFFLCQNVGLRHTSAGHATLILAGGLPVLTAILAACFLGERPTRCQLTGLASALIGVVAVAAVGKGAGSSLQGDGWLLLAAAVGAAYTVLARRAFTGPDPLALLSGSTLWGALLLVPPAAAEVAVTGAVWPSPSSFGMLLYLGIGCSALAFTLSAFGLRHLTAAQNAIMGALELPIGLAAAALLLGEVLSPIQLAGSALLLAGAALTIARDATASAARDHSIRGTIDDRHGMDTRGPGADPRRGRPHGGTSARADGRDRRESRWGIRPGAGQHPCSWSLPAVGAASRRHDRLWSGPRPARTMTMPGSRSPSP